MGKNLLFQLMVLLVVSAVTSLAQAQTEIANKEELRNRLGELAQTSDLSQIKIAILDNGFSGFRPNIGLLPDSAELIEGPLKFPSSNSHGLGMAQIVWAMTGQSPQGPKFYLLNTHGFTNFKAAVDFVVKNKVDIVLYSQIWLFGSNFDGKGFINKVVNKATDQGVIWINAAGNLGGHVHTGGVNSSPKRIKLKNILDENSFTVTLVWNDFTDNESECTRKDLNLELLDSRNNVIQTAELVQQGQVPDLNNPADRRSCYARESMSIKSLNRGDYQLRVVAKTNNFGPRDQFKILISDDRPQSLDFTDKTVGFEIMPPADNANVITVGDRSPLSSLGPTADGRIKPDFLIADSKVSFTNGNLTFGSSNAAAMLAGSVVLLKSLKKDLTSRQLFRYAESLRQQLIIPAGMITPSHVPSWLQNHVPAGGMVRIHPVAGRVVIFTKEAPLSIPSIQRFNLQARQSDDIVACNEYLTACWIYPWTQDSFLRAPLIEFKQFLPGPIGPNPGVWQSTQHVLSKL